MTFQSFPVPSNNNNNKRGYSKQLRNHNSNYAERRDRLAQNNTECSFRVSSGWLIAAAGQLAENKYTKSIAVMPFATTTVQPTGAVQWISITHMDDEL